MAKKDKESKEGTSNCYEILEVSPRASPEVIQAAYKALQKQHAPGSDVRKSIDDAAKHLLDANKRGEYDDAINNHKGKVIGQYRVLELIAQGGHASTYKGEHIVIGEPVCIKHPHHYSPQDEEILMQEAKAIWDLRHSQYLR